MKQGSEVFSEKTGIPETKSVNIDIKGLEHDLKKSTQAEVRFDQGSRALYATDSSNYRHVPIGVVIPKNIDQVEKAMSVCRKYGAPVVFRGAGTSLSGQTCNVAVAFDFSKYMRKIISIDANEKTAVVQSGVLHEQLNQKADAMGLMYGPDPSTHLYCTFGGMIGNDSCGMHSQFAGRTSQNVEELEVLTYDGYRLKLGKYDPQELENIVQKGGRKGEILSQLKHLVDKYGDLIRTRFPQIPRLVSGYRLDYLLPENGFDVAKAMVGSEGTCVNILEAKVKLLDKKPHRIMVVIGFPDIYVAGDYVPKVAGFNPIALEGMDQMLLENMKKKNLHVDSLALLPEGKGWLIAEFGSSDLKEAESQAQKLIDHIKKDSQSCDIRYYQHQNQHERIWEVRESGLGATAFVPGQRDAWPGFEDTAIPPESVGAYLRDLHKLFKKYNYTGALYGHFGQGCIHTRITFDLKTANGIADYRAFVEEGADLVVSYGGSLSAEHGDGQARSELLEKMYGPELMEAFKEFKSIWDPLGKMNPGRVVDPYPLDQNLRLGADYNPKKVSTVFSYPEDGGDFAHATMRCVGVGKCRRIEGGTMCPSYMVTKEEKHTTRGRAHSLFEMMQGDVIKGGWKSKEVKDSLELCLSCKGCKSDCPVNVDMATYKAEFLHHHYKGKLRPRQAYAMGYIFYWARLASLWPEAVNWVSNNSLMSPVVKFLGGIAAERKLPQFAPQTFRDWFFSRQSNNPGSREVILWPDTFNNHFHPSVAKNATEVLESAGYHVRIPQVHLCCGRPLYDYGLLNSAKKQLEKVLHTLRPYIREGYPLVGLEPSCTAVFRDELKNIFPKDPDAHRLSEQTYTLGEFLEKEATHFRLPIVNKKALLHGHCHHKAIMGNQAEKNLYKKMGMDSEELDSGCCGMAGSFGFEKGEKYDVSVAAGERVLLPKVRQAANDTLILADGFSCKEQIEQGTGKNALHLADILHQGLLDEDRLQSSSFQKITRKNKWISSGRKLAIPFIAIATGIIAGIALITKTKRN